MSSLIDQLGRHAGGSEQQILDEEGNVRKEKQREPSEQELQQSYVAPGVPAHLRRGIVYYGPWKFAADGLGRHCREQVKALAAAGVPLQLQSLGSSRILNDELHDDVREVEYLSRVTFTETALSIKQFIFSSISLVQELICPKGMRTEDNIRALGARTVLYTSWERDRVYPQLVEELNKVAQVWVPCQANYEAFASSGVDSSKLRVVPYPYDPKEAKIAFPRGSEEAPDGKRFYHIGKWEPRKNQHQLLGAFLQAFTPKEKASLLIKSSGFGTHWTNYPSPEESVSFWLEHPKVREQGWTAEKMNRRVRIIMDRISEEDIEMLHKKNNIYVSSGLGEAWDIPAFTAKLSGNCLVYVGYGGPSDFALEGDIPVEHTLGPVHPGYGWETGARWAKVSTEDFAKALRSAEPPKRRMTPPHYYRSFSHVAVGRTMWGYLQEILGVEDELITTVGGFG